MEQTFVVGEVLYILSKKGTMTAVPAIVVEVVSRKTMSGDTVSYKVLASTAKGNVPFDLSKLEEGEGGDIFTDSYLLQEEMSRRMNALVMETMTRLSAAVANLNEECAIKKADTVRTEKGLMPKIPEVTVSLKDEDENIEYVTLPNGQKVKARLKFPT